MSFEKAFEAYIANSDLMFSSGTSVSVEWSPESILSLESPSNYAVDIDLLGLNTATREWTKLATLGTELPNSGSADVSIPDIQQQNTPEQAVTVVVVQVGLSLTSINPASLTQRGVNSDLLASLSQNALKTIVNGPVRFLNRAKNQTVQRSLCSEWSSRQSVTTLENILTQFAHCPLKLENVRIPNQGFMEESRSSMIPITGSIRDFTDTVVDDTFQEYFYPETTTCFRQRLVARYDIGTTCCFYCTA